MKPISPTTPSCVKGFRWRSISFLCTSTLLSRMPHPRSLRARTSRMHRALLALLGLALLGGPRPEPGILCLGDSYTVGEGVSRDERWPERLAAALDSEGAWIGSPEIIARTGWTSDELF